MAREEIGGLIKRTPHNKNYKELYDRVDNLVGRFIFQRMVESFADLATAFQYPKTGYAVYVKNDRVIYRYNGTEWIVAVDLTDFQYVVDEANRMITIVDDKVADMTTLENTVSTNEDVRLTNESTRQENEQNRVNAEGVRETQEQNRIDTFSTNEASRQNEFDINEQTRQENETVRISDENARQNSEAVRSSSENTRVENENQRVADETIRKQMEHIGEYNSTLTYLKNNMVIYNGSTFMALQDIPIETYPDPTLDTDYWQRVALHSDIEYEPRVSSLESTAQDYNNHLNNNMPHLIEDIDTGKMYRYGYRLKNGGMQVIYEEVI